MTTAVLSTESEKRSSGTLARYVEHLHDALGGEFAVVDRLTGDRWDPDSGWTETLDEQQALTLFPETKNIEPLDWQSSPTAVAFPLPSAAGRLAFAIGLFRTDDDDLRIDPAIATLFDRSAEDLLATLSAAPEWHWHSLLRAAKLAFRNLNLETRVTQLQAEVESVSDNLAGTYEEISLLYGITQNLRLSSSEVELGGLALNWLSECVPARGLGTLYLPVPGSDRLTYEARTEAHLQTSGEFPLTIEDINSIVEQFGMHPTSQPYVKNHLNRDRDWQFPEVSELLMAPLSEGKNLFGWLVAVNHDGEGEFGTVEAALMNSVAVILGTHGGNIDLYRRQKEFLASVVRALTSAIDAKDPYTCGHSDRVARVSVRLAQELGCNEDQLNTIYMAGLVHDIGKIGINDAVLRKPGRLTNAEFEQIKLHPELGYKILADIPQFADVLPVVLHHHEQWDGQGYPHGLAGEDIPYLARICAVADAYDAMSSDRPYRKGMVDKKVDAIFHAGDGKQWDTNVVAAFFQVRDDIRRISQDERANLTLDVRQWAQSHAALQS